MMDEIVPHFLDDPDLEIDQYEEPTHYLMPLVILALVLFLLYMCHLWLKPPTLVFSPPSPPSFSRPVWWIPGHSS